MVDAPLILSKSAFAARRGVAVSAISKWIARGKIAGAALTPDGKIDVTEAERQLGSTLDLSRSAGAIAGRAVEAAAVPAAPVPAPKPAGGDLGEMAQIKLERAQRELQREREADLERRGLYVRSAEVRREFARELAELLQTVERRLPELVQLLGGGKAEVVAARRWWRSLRQAESDAATEQAETEPELTEECTPALESAHAA